jgi:NAD(P)-dependent dehydrogenase (short-subunit alcohol dehydrogenase family)
VTSVVITGADRGFGLELSRRFLAEGWRVFAGQFMPQWTELAGLAADYPQSLVWLPLDVSSRDSVIRAVELVAAKEDHVDVLINNAGMYGRDGDIRGTMDFAMATRLFDVNSLGPVRMVEAFLPLMRVGIKRLCFVSSEAGSISVCWRDALFGYCMSKTALNMAIRIMHNQLHRQGFRFRVYHPDRLRSYMSGRKNLEATVEPADSAAVALRQFLADRSNEGSLMILDHKDCAWPFGPNSRPWYPQPRAKSVTDWRKPCSGEDGGSSSGAPAERTAAPKKAPRSLSTRLRTGRWLRQPRSSPGIRTTRISSCSSPATRRNPAWIPSPAGSPSRRSAGRTTGTP